MVLGRRGTIADFAPMTPKSVVFFFVIVVLLVALVPKAVGLVAAGSCRELTPSIVFGVEFTSSM
jgi:hypothetical protein